MEGLLSTGPTPSSLNLQLVNFSQVCLPGCLESWASVSSEKVVFPKCGASFLSRQVSASYYQEELQQYKEEFDHLVLIVNIGGYVSNPPCLPLSHFLKISVSNY